MERIVSVLNDIDEKAEQIIAAAASVKASMYEEYLEKVASCEEDLLTGTDNRLLEIKKEKGLSLEQKKKQIDKTRDTRLREMEDNYKLHHRSMVDNIFKKIIEV